MATRRKVSTKETRVSVSKAKAPPIEVGIALPAPKGRASFYKELRRLSGAELSARLQQWHADMETHPDHAAHQALERHLVAAHFDPAVRASRNVYDFVFFVREWLADSLPGETIAHRLEMIRTLLTNHGGGAPKADVRWRAWRNRFETLRRTQGGEPVSHTYKDVAAWWNAGGTKKHPRKPVAWTTVRDGISKLKKL